MIDDQTRYTTKQVAFAKPFTLTSSELLPAGTYLVETTEERHELSEHTIWVRTETVLMVPTNGGMRHCQVRPHDLDRALQQDSSLGTDEANENPQRGADPVPPQLGVRS